MKRTRIAVAFARWNFFWLYRRLKPILNSNEQTPELEAECYWKEGWRHRWYHKDTLSS